jgi:hypothetical protein
VTCDWPDVLYLQVPHKSCPSPPTRTTRTRSAPRSRKCPVA